MRIGRLILILIAVVFVVHTCSNFGKGKTVLDLLSGTASHGDTSKMSGEDYVDCCVRANLDLRQEHSQNTFSTDEERASLGDLLLVGSVSNTGDRNLAGVTLEIRSQQSKGGLEETTTLSTGPIDAGQSIRLREFALSVHDTSLDDNPDTARFELKYKIYPVRATFAR